MKLHLKSKSVLWRALLAGMFVFSLLALTPQASLAQDLPPNEFPAVLDRCMGFYQRPVNCTAEDVRIERVMDVQFSDYCDDPPDPELGYDTLTATFTLMISAENSPDRYDVGLFMAADGGSAMSDGICYRDYLAPPFTTPTGTFPVYTDDWGGGVDGNMPDLVPEIYEIHTLTTDTLWWDADGDACGDLQTRTQIFMTNVEVTVACSDSPDDDGTNADISVCMSYEQVAKNNCGGFDDAIPGTASKCACAILDFPFTPTALTQMSLEARTTETTTDLAWGGLGLLMVAGASGTYFLRRKQIIKAD